MAFRGFFALNNVEISNSSRVIAHLGRDIPTDDASVFGTSTSTGGTDLPFDLPADFGAGASSVNPCSLVQVSPGLYEIPESSHKVSKGLYTLPNGARRFGPGLYTVGDCWGPAAICASCATRIHYDDSWTGLKNFLGDPNPYRPEVAPWYTTELPESSEFGGVWVMDVNGLDVTPGQRSVTQAVGHGGVAAPHRDAVREVSFEALLVACTNAGVDYGLKWLTCLLRDTNDNTDSSLQYFAAHPQHSLVDPANLLRETHNVVLTSGPEITEKVNTGGKFNQQANLYRITWTMATLSPYAYLPAVDIAVDWDRITRQPINWIHAADCAKPETCVAMPVMFSTECVPEEIEHVSTPPPVCGGCMPVSAIDKYTFRVPTMDYAFRCRETVVSTVIRNTGESSLTLQAFWRVCGTDIRCEDNRFPLQVAGLPAGAELHLDGVSGRFWAFHDERKRRPVGVVGTPNGAPWRPPLIDRKTCWDFVVQTSSDVEFEVELVLHDREP